MCILPQGTIEDLVVCYLLEVNQNNLPSRFPGQSAKTTDSKKSLTICDRNDLAFSSEEFWEVLYQVRPFRFFKRLSIFMFENSKERVVSELH